MVVFGLKILKIAGIAFVLLGVAAIAVVTTPILRGQTLRDRSFTGLRGHALMGSEIGVSLRDVDDADVRRDKLQSSAGAVVEDVQADGPAAKAGFKAGDVVVSFDGEKVRSARHLTRLVQDTADHREVEAVLVRAGEKVTVKVTPQATDLSTVVGRALEPLRNMRAFDLPGRFSMNIGPTDRWTYSRGTGMDAATRRGGRLGIGVQDLTPQLGDYFGAKDGVLVTSVDDDTPAKTAGLKAGDVLTKIDGQAVRDTNELRRRIAQASGDVTITLVRDRKELTLKAKL